MSDGRGEDEQGVHRSAKPATADEARAGSSPAPSATPEKRVIAALRGAVAEVFAAGFGVRGPGAAVLLTRPRPAVLAAARAKHGLTWAPRPFAWCRRCGAVLDPVPDPPSSRGLNGAPEPLFPLDTRAGALFVLSWLGRVDAAHACPEATEAPGAPKADL